MIHLPTGIVESCQGRKRESNLREAKQAILETLQKQKDNSIACSINNNRKTQVGSGMRGDKIRTYRFQDDKIIDHQINKSFNLKMILKGNIDKFWE